MWLHNGTLVGSVSSGPETPKPPTKKHEEGGRGPVAVPPAAGSKAAHVARKKAELQAQLDELLAEEEDTSSDSEEEDLRGASN